MSKASISQHGELHKTAPVWQVLEAMADCLYCHGKGDNPLAKSEILQLAAMADALSKQARKQANDAALTKAELLLLQEEKAGLEPARQQTVAQMRASLAADNVVLFPIIPRRRAQTGEK